MNQANREDTDLGTHLDLKIGDKGDTRENKWYDLIQFEQLGKFCFGVVRKDRRQILVRLYIMVPRRYSGGNSRRSQGWDSKDELESLFGSHLNGSQLGLILSPK